MKSIVKWSVIVLLILVALIVIWIGPGRLYGILRSKQIVGTIEKVQPQGSSTSQVPSEFIVEVAQADGEIFTFISADPKWGVMSKGDHVKAMLYPAPPWSGDGGGWRDARLIAKLSRLPGEENMAAATGKAPKAATVAATPPPHVPVSSAPRNNVVPKPSTHPAANKPTAQSGMLLTFGTAGLPAVLLGLGRGLLRSRQKTASHK